MGAKRLSNMTATELVMECMAKGIPCEGEDAEVLRKKLAPKKPAPNKE